MQINDRDVRLTIKESIVKIDVKAKALCTWCHIMLSYGGKGKRNLLDHLTSDSHKKAVKDRLSNQTLGSFVVKELQNQSKVRIYFPLFLYSIGLLD